MTGNEVEMFTIRVDINPGLEPQELSIKAYCDTRAVINRLFVFEILLQGKAIAILVPAEGSWCQLEGKLGPPVVRRIGGAIEEYYDLADQ